MLQGLGPLVSTLVIGAGQQILDQVTAAAELSLCQLPAVGQLEREHGGCVVECEAVQGAGAPVRVEQQQHPEHVAT